MRVGVSNVNLHGRVRFAMAPLISKIPVVGGVKVICQALNLNTLDRS